MKYLTIRFINTKGIVSRLITGETFSLMDHCEGLSRDGNSWVGAHAWTGVQARSLDWADEDIIWCREYTIPCTEEEYEDAMAFMDKHVLSRTRYNYRGVFGVFVHDRNATDRTRIDCSDFMIQWLWAARKKVLNVRPGESWMVTPEMLHLSPIFIGRGTSSNAAY